MKWLILLLLVLSTTEAIIDQIHGTNFDEYCKLAGNLKPRPHSVSILEFGAVGDGKTLNTVAFQNAIFYLTSFSDKGGAQLYVPKGRWLTGSFKLISHLTLFLDEDAVIIATQDLSQWPITGALPSYGKESETLSERYRSLIHGQNLTDVVITGENGTIDGQGFIWWDLFRSHSLNYSRPHLLEFVNSNNIVVSNLTLLNAPAWSIHPVYCSHVQVQNMTITAPSDSPSTNGVVPDSSSNVCIEDSSISVGQDAISLKSGWDQYGISYNKPVSNVYIRRISLQTPLGSALAFGSEMSGGISHIHAERIQIRQSSTGIVFKTTKGRGGFIKDVFISDVKMENVQTAMCFTGHCGSHPDGKYDPNALPILDRITLKNVVGWNISIAGVLSGIDRDPFTNICLSDINLSMEFTSSSPWYCSNVSGFSEFVFPDPCPSLQYSNSSSACYSPQNFVGHSSL